MNGATVLTKFTADTKDFDSKTKGVTASLGSLTKSVVAGLGITKAFSAAWGAVTRNMDSAIDRFDTLNNFPKVMSNLGISAEDSQKSINKMSEALIGLPTTLDEGALAVQRLTAKNGDIKKSTDLFLAMNNAILAGGAPAQIQSTALEQLTQAYAKGKPDMMEWRTLMTAMPAQLKQVATAMGYVSAEDLGAVVREKGGEEEFKRLIDTMMELNTKGLPGFQNFEEQARNSTNGVRTAITNMNSRITQGVTAMIESVDKGLKDAKLGGIAKVFETIGNTVRDTLKSLAPYITKGIVLLKDAFSWINKNKDTIIAIAKVMLPLLAAMKIYNTYVGIHNTLLKMSANGELAWIKNLGQITLGFLKGTAEVVKNTAQLVINKTAMLASAAATKAVTAAQWLLNAAMSASPIFWIIAAIVALVAILVVLWNKCEWFKNFWIGLWENIKSAVGVAIDFIKLAWEGLKIAFEIIAAVVKAVINRIVNEFNKFKNSISNVVNHVKNFASSIINVFKSIPSKVVNIGKNIGQGLWNGIKGVKDWVINKVKGMGKSILNGLKSVLGVHSPSKEFALIGKFSVLGYTESLDKMTKDVQGQINETFGVSPQLANSSALHYSPSVNTTVNVSQTQDPLGRMVNDIKTFSGGAKNDYNYGMGV